MTDEELVKQLRTASVQCDDMRLRDFGYLFKTAAEAIERLVAYNEFWEHSAHKAKKLLEEKLPQWIPVTEWLPDKEYVLSWDGQHVGFLHAAPFETFLEYANNRGISHWMPLPEPPTEVDT